MKEGKKQQILLRWNPCLCSKLCHYCCQPKEMLSAVKMGELTIEMQQPCRGASSCLQQGNIDQQKRHVLASVSMGLYQMTKSGQCSP